MQKTSLTIIATWNIMKGWCCRSIFDRTTSACNFLLPLVATRALAAWLAFLFISFSTAHHTINYPVIYDALFGPIKSTILHIKGGKLRAASLLIAFMNVRRAKINCRHRRRRPPALANNLSRLVCVCVCERAQRRQASGLARSSGCIWKEHRPDTSK